MKSAKPTIRSRALAEPRFTAKHGVPIAIQESKGSVSNGDVSLADSVRRRLLKLGLFPEQVRRLELIALRGIRARLYSPPPMANVRAKLTDLAKLLNRLEGQYIRLSVPASAESAEAANRLYMAQDSLGEPIDALHDSLNTATEIVRRALADLPRIQRRPRRGRGEFARLILRALHLGHAEHHNCTGFGAGPVRGRMPAFEIRTGRNARLFTEIVQSVADATGGWNAEEEIRAFAKGPRSGRKRVGNRPRKSLI